jgi:fructuronate reductase
MTPVSRAVHHFVMTAFLSQANLPRVPREVKRPGYDRRALDVGIVHFGPGAFHRVHQAWFIEKLLATDPRWGICGVSLRSTDVRDALAPQDGLYTLATLDGSTSYQVIGAMKQTLVAPEDPETVLEQLCASRTHVVTITVTEKGYCLGPDGNLDMAHADIRRDLRSPHAPVSLIGFLVEALRRRRASGAGPLTVVSCDNLVDNGSRLARAVVQLAEADERNLAHWIEEKVAFPRTMVDSITPATTDTLREKVGEVLGLSDRWPVQREGFAQWVIEDRSAGDTPDWESAGVTVTDDVGAYDRAKLRLLNGAHSSLAYLGLLAGHETVAEAMEDADLAAFIGTMMKRDILPTIKAPRGLDLSIYIQAILKRFRNPAIRHALAQIAWDGSQKLPFRLLGTIVDDLQAGRPIDRLCVPVAAWFHFVRRKALGGEQVVDPLAKRLYEIGRACQNRASADLPAFLSLNSVFPASLTGNEVFTSALARAYDGLAAGS